MLSRGLCFVTVLEMYSNDLFLGKSLNWERLRERNLLDLLHFRPGNHCFDSFNLFVKKKSSLSGKIMSEQCI